MRNQIRGSRQSGLLEIMRREERTAALISNVVLEAVTEDRFPNMDDFKRAGLKREIKRSYEGDPKKAVDAALASGHIDFRIVRGE